VWEKEIIKKKERKVDLSTRNKKNERRDKRKWEKE
jgi:hypothetical protein